VTGPDLDGLLAEIARCRACAGELPHEPRPVLRVFPETRLLICGQAPGRRVHESGLPFDDPSGDRLRDWLGLDRERFYGDRRIGVAAMAFCYPGTAPGGGGDYPPPPRCASLWRERLLASLSEVRLTLLVGTYAQRWALGRNARSLSVLALPHPSWRNTAWLKRHPWFEADVLPELRRRTAAVLA
jgi:uracil-DNA glycosylase